MKTYCFYAVALSVMLLFTSCASHNVYDGGTVKIDGVMDQQDTIHVRKNVWHTFKQNCPLLCDFYITPLGQVGIDNSLQLHFTFTLVAVNVPDSMAAIVMNGMTLVDNQGTTFPQTAPAYTLPIVAGPYAGGEYDFSDNSTPQPNAGVFNGGEVIYDFTLSCKKGHSVTIQLTMPIVPI